MPTKKPRLTFMVEPELYRILVEATEATGQSMSSLCVELLSLAAPTVEKTTRLYLSIRQAAIIDRRAIAASCDRALAELEPLAQKADQLLQASFSEIDEGQRDANNENP